MELQSPALPACTLNHLLYCIPHTAGAPTTHIVAEDGAVAGARGALDVGRDEAEVEWLGGAEASTGEAAGLCGVCW